MSLILGFLLFWQWWHIFLFFIQLTTITGSSGSPGDRGNLRADDDSWLRRHLRPPWHATGHEPHSAAEGSPPQIKQLAFQFCRPLLFGSTLNFTLAECCPLPKRVQVSQDPLSFVREDFPSSILSSLGMNCWRLAQRLYSGLHFAGQKCMYI